MPQTPKSIPVTLCLHQLFEQQAQDRPHSIAVTCGQQSITYEELNQRSNRLAHQLLTFGPTLDQPIGILSARSITMIVSMLAVLKAGACYVPLDPAYPTERLTFICKDAGIRILLADQPSLAHHCLDLTQFHVLDPGGASTDLLQADPNAFSLFNPFFPVSPNDLAYIIYTSGSTGRPKGVTITHANVVHLFRSTHRLWNFTAQDTWSLFHSFSFDVSVWEIWGALLHGGRLVVIPYLSSRSPEEFAHLLISERVTILSQTPTAFEQLLAKPKLVANLTQSLIRLVVLAGERLNITSLQPWFDSSPSSKAQIVNMYGITETTIHSTHFTITPEIMASDQRSLIGSPLEHLRIHLLGEDRMPVSAGEIGEIYVEGAGVARGYLNRPDLTVERFLPNPFPDPVGPILYRSGDFARSISPTCMESLGRMDDQVKIRGFRIELCEIQNTLNQHPFVERSIVLVEPVEADQRLVAFIVLKLLATNFRDLLRTYLRNTLPDYMIPSRFVSIETIPMTENGKVDKRALLTNSYVLTHKFPDPRNHQGRPMIGFFSPISPESQS